MSDEPSIYSIEPKELTIPEVHRYLLGGVSPRPIALVSTVSADGDINLSPFSFFNAFGANPPTVAFSPARKGKTGELKDTYNNLVATRECVIQAVTYTIAHQVNLASAEYPTGVNEFEKAGLTMVGSDLVKPPRVKESPFQLECRLQQMINLGDEGGSGNLAICEVIKFHIDRSIIDQGMIAHERIDLVGRMGGAWYSRTVGEAAFTIDKPATTGIGFDGLPDFIRHSEKYSANDVAQLAGLPVLPDPDVVSRFIAEFGAVETHDDQFLLLEREGKHHEMLRGALASLQNNEAEGRDRLERTARVALRNGRPDFALHVALYAGYKTAGEIG